MKENKDEILKIRLTKREKDLIRKKAKECDYNISQ